MMTNPPILYLSVFIASLVYVFCRSAQQINVSKKLYTLIPVFSMAMAFVEVYVVATTARNGWEWMLVFLIGLGSGLGSLSATYFHSRIFKEKT